MKKLAVLACAVLAAGSPALGQVIANFESGLNGYQVTNWGTALKTIQRIPDPTGRSQGVLQANFSFPAHAFDKGAINVGTPVSAHGAKMITYWIYLPQGIPDKLHMVVFAQDNASWIWNQSNFTPADIPKETWYPISFDLAQAVTKDSINIATAQIFTGIQIDNGPWQDSAWTGAILVDNVTLEGVQPVSVADFETGLDGFQSDSLGSALTGMQRIPDPTATTLGVLQATFTFPTSSYAKGGVRMATPIDASGAAAVTYWVNLPAGIPDGLRLVVSAQDDSSATRSQSVTPLAGIPRQTWYPVSLDLAQAMAGGSMTLSTAGIVPGFAVDNGADSSVSWAGNILIDNVELWNAVVVPPPKKYVFTDFSTWGDLGGFTRDTVLGLGVTALANGVDTTNAANRVLVADYSFSDTGAGPVTSGAFVRNTIPIFSAAADTTATDIAIDAYIPPGVPDSTRFVLGYQGSATSGTWTQDQYLLAGGLHDLRAGRWSMLKYSVAGHIADHSITNTRGNGAFVVEVITAEPVSWSGEMFYDNFVLLGITQVTAVQEAGAVIAQYRLEHNYPNPFNPSTTIRYELKFAVPATLTVCDVLGRVVRTLVNEVQKGGQHAVQFDATGLASGTYFYTLRAGSYVRTEKMLFLK